MVRPIRYAVARNRRATVTAVVLALVAVEVTSRSGVVWRLITFTYQVNALAAAYYLWSLLSPRAVSSAGLLSNLFIGQSQGRVRWWQPVAWLAYPIAYLALALLVLNEAGRRAPYYFLDADSVETTVVIGNVALLAAGFLALGYLLSAMGRSAVRARSTDLPV